MCYTFQRLLHIVTYLKLQWTGLYTLKIWQTWWKYAKQKGKKMCQYSQLILWNMLQYVHHKFKLLEKIINYSIVFSF